MPGLFSNSSSSATSVNQQVAVNGSGSGQSGTLKGGSQAASGGLSFVINTGNNKNRSTAGTSRGGGGGQGKGILGKGGKGGNSGAATGSNGDVGSGGNVTINATTDDVEAIHAITDISHDTLETVRHSNDALAALASQVVQAGEDLGSVAIPTFAATQIAGRPVDLAYAGVADDYVNSQAVTDQGEALPGLLHDKWFLIAAGAGVVLLIAAVFHRR